MRGKGKLKSIAVMAYCHFSVSLLCLNVLFDLTMFGFPLYLLHIMRILPYALFLRLTTLLIEWTTPIVFAMPLVFSGTKVFCNDLDLLVEAKASDSSLLLANHGSRIDWMVGMFVGFTTTLGVKACKRVRVGFVCEALIQFMPIIGWYRKLVARDIFVWRSFKQDAATIRGNIQGFIAARERRMLFLSPEGVVVDYGDADFEYIDACRKFCIMQNYEPFEYVLTPRYKGSMCLFDHVEGPIISVVIVYVRNGKLLNCRLISPDRVIPDIYTLNQGVGGSPVDIFIHLKRMDLSSQRQNKNQSDPKMIFLENYREKDSLLRKWDEQLLAGTASGDSWMSQFSAIESNHFDYWLYQISHTLLLIVIGIFFDRLDTLAWVFGVLSFIVSSCHSIGWALNSTSMESVPMETGIKAIAGWLLQTKKGN